MDNTSRQVRVVQQGIWYKRNKDIDVSDRKLCGCIYYIFKVMIILRIVFLYLFVYSIILWKILDNNF